MRTLDIVLLIVACVLFALSTLSVIPDGIRLRLVGAGLLAATLVPLITLVNAG